MALFDRAAIWSALIDDDTKRLELLLNDLSREQGRDIVDVVRQMEKTMWKHSKGRGGGELTEGKSYGILRIAAGYKKKIHPDGALHCLRYLSTLKQTCFPVSQIEKARKDAIKCNRVECVAVLDSMLSPVTAVAVSTAKQGEHVSIEQQSSGENVQKRDVASSTPKSSSASTTPSDTQPSGIAVRNLIRFFENGGRPFKS